jgi:hypothetical protein
MVVAYGDVDGNHTLLRDADSLISALTNRNTDVLEALLISRIATEWLALNVLQIELNRAATLGKSWSRAQWELKLRLIDAAARRYDRAVRNLLQARRTPVPQVLVQAVRVEHQAVNGTGLRRLQAGQAQINEDRD